MEERETSPLIKLIEDQREELARRMVAATTVVQRANLSAAQLAEVEAGMQRVLDTVTHWLRSYALGQDDAGIMVALDLNPLGEEVTAEMAIQRVDRTMQVIADFAAERFDAGREADRAARQLRSAAAYARLIVANEVMRRAGK